MGFFPLVRGNKTQLVSLPAGSTAEDTDEWAAEQERVETVVRARAYYEGTQYDAINQQAADTLCGGDIEALPEHERLHNYSTHVSESVDFVADQLSSGFAVKAKSAAVQAVIDDAAAATEALTSDDDDVAVTCDAVLREALLASDVPYEVKWDPFEETVYYEFWESEHVQFVNPFGSHVSAVIRRERRWVTDPDDPQNKRKEVEERVEYRLHVNDLGFKECRKDTYWDTDEEPRRKEWLGLPIIPWGLLRAARAGLREFRGKSFITTQVMDAVKRYNALEQYGFLVTRYNSHGSLVTIGDAASLQQQADQGVHRDVADVLRFPSGTQAFPLQLPTSTEMLEHQRRVLEEAIYKKFGLTRVEPETLETLGGVSGYALEILNRKSEATMSRVKRQWKKDWKALVNLTLDVYAYMDNAVIVIPGADGELIEVDEDEIQSPDFEMDVLPTRAFWEVDPSEVFDDREIDVTMGTGYIVDDVAIRDDFTAKLISQQEALRKRGYADDEIKDIMEEQKESSPQEAQISPEARAAAAAAAAGQPAPASGAPAQPVGGGTLRSTDRTEE